MQLERIDEVRQWLELVEQDLQLADRALHGAPPLLEGAIFHCQQAAEKALKGYLVWYDRPFRKTHHLSEVLALCVTVEGVFSALSDAARTLNRYGVNVRYPAVQRIRTLEEAEQALCLAREVVAFVVDRLPPEVRP